MATVVFFWVQMFEKSNIIIQHNDMEGKQEHGSYDLWQVKKHSNDRLCLKL